MKIPDTLAVVDDVRKFNRFYTKHIGVLNAELLQSQFSLAEARVLYELAHEQEPTASGIGGELNLTKGYLSQILKKFDQLGLVEKTVSTLDMRKSILHLTQRGRHEFAKLDEMSREQVNMLIRDLTPAAQHKLVESMDAIEKMLGPDRESHGRSVLVRPPEPGDLGWVVHVNGRIYADEYGWDQTYEALVAQIVSDFVKNYDPNRERCWIAEEVAENIGSVFLVRQTDEIARLRLLIVDPKARGLGLGKRLVDQCTRFARQAGYKKITLWTNSVLTVARAIYVQAGYQLVKSEPGRLFGHDLISETWELEL